MSLHENVAGRCPVTGLVVTTRPEWTDVRIGPNTTVTWRLIGDSILDNVTVGERMIETQAPLMAFRDRLVGELFPPGHKYVETYDLSGVVGIPPSEVRRQHSLFHISNSYRDCSGVYVYGSNLFLRSVYRTSLAVAGGGLWYPFKVVKGYAEAVRAGVDNLRSHVVARVGTRIEDDNFWTRPGWTIPTSDGLGEVRISVGFRRVILMEMIGILNDTECAPKAIEVMDGLFRDGFIAGPWHVKITDYSKLASSSMATRMRYAQELKSHYQRLPVPVNKSYVVGASTWVKVAIRFAGNIITPPKGLEFVSSRRECFDRVAQLLSRTEIGTGGVADSEPEEFVVLRPEVSRLTAMLGSLAWGQTDADGIEGFPDGHPLCEVGEAIRLVKGDYHNVLEKHREAERAALLASRSKSEFLANMSHEIRTPLNGVIGMLQLLGQEPLDETSSRYASIALGSAQSLLGIVNDILDFSKIEAGRLEREEVIFDLRGCLQEFAILMEHQAKDRGLVLNVKADDDIPSLMVGDVTRIRQVMSNLVGNAIKFTPHGEIKVKIGLLESGKESVKLRFSVSDTGIGIASDKLETIFESFSQADTSTTRKYGGTGLGLAISRKLVALLGGVLMVRSSMGEGSEFWFDLELGLVGANTAGKDLERATCGVSDGTAGCVPTRSDPSSVPDPPSSIAGEEPARKTLRVLVVEDNAVNAKVASGFLKRLECDADLAENGKVALEKLAIGGFDMVLMDCQMPVMDGFEAVRRIRAGEARATNRSIPVVALTAAARESDRDQALLAGMDDFLSKPFTMSALREVVERWGRPDRNRRRS
jgi:signal transduction histidine kinase/ActR/RegA family two-component response regulator